MGRHGAGVCTLLASGRRALGNVPRTRQTDRHPAKWQPLVSVLSSRHLRGTRLKARPPVPTPFVGVGALALAYTGVKFGWPFPVPRSENAVLFVPIKPIKREMVQHYRSSCSKFHFLSDVTDRLLCVSNGTIHCITHNVYGLRYQRQRPVLKEKNFEIRNSTVF